MYPFFPACCPLYCPQFNISAGLFPFYLLPNVQHHSSDNAYADCVHLKQYALILTITSVRFTANSTNLLFQWPFFPFHSFHT